MSVTLNHILDFRMELGPVGKLPCLRDIGHWIIDHPWSRTPQTRTQRLVRWFYDPRANSKTWDNERCYTVAARLFTVGLGLAAVVLVAREVDRRAVMRACGTPPWSSTIPWYYILDRSDMSPECGDQAYIPLPNGQSTAVPSNWESLVFENKDSDQVRVIVA